MRKTHYRDYATEAFRLFAREGSAEEYKKRIYREAIEQRGGGGGTQSRKSSVEAGIIRAEAALEKNMAAIQDLAAVEEAYRKIKNHPAGHEIIKAVAMVYGKYPDTPLTKGEITSRVNRAAYTLKMEQRTVYRYLARAAEEFARARGLRT